jgi:hypothetical protein
MLCDTSTLQGHIQRVDTKDWSASTIARTVHRDVDVDKILPRAYLQDEMSRRIAGEHGSIIIMT